MLHQVSFKNRPSIAQYFKIVEILIEIKEKKTESNLFKKNVIENHRFLFLYDTPHRQNIYNLYKKHCAIRKDLFGTYPPFRKEKTFEKEKHHRAYTQTNTFRKGEKSSHNFAAFNRGLVFSHFANLQQIKKEFIVIWHRWERQMVIYDFD